MKRARLLILILFASCGKNEITNQEIISSEGEKILVGLINREGLSKPPYSDWFNEYYTSYEADESTLTGLNMQMNDLDILVFLGTWCSDSQVQIPQFYKILDYLDFDQSKLTVVALERSPDGTLESPRHEEADFMITNVPTWIFFRNQKEIGRIVEYPETTLEKDMVRILTAE